MRILEFNVQKQRLMRMPTCDFGGLIAGSVGYLMAKFNFSDEWDGCTKAANFILNDETGKTERGALLDKNDTCVIPQDVLTGREFSVTVVGVKDHGRYRIESSDVKVKQGVNN